MDSVDVHVLRTLKAWLSAGRRAALFTVVRTWGSSPRPVGALMALAEGGAVVGSVSGGCVEDDLLARFESNEHRDGMAWDGPGCEFLRYGVTATEARRFGLPCGGTLELLLERRPDPGKLDELVEHLAAGELVRRSVRVADGRVTLSAAGAPAVLELAGGIVSQTFGPGYRMLLIGAGQLAEYLATMALFNGFAVTVCDPRSEYRVGWQVPGMIQVTDMPDDAVIAFRPDRRSAVIALSHDPKLDDLALIDALSTDAMYVGAIGSRRNTTARRERLATHFGLGEQALDRLHAPIGLYIGSKTPAEIAVSIMAEVLAVKNGVRLPAAMDVAIAKREIESGV
jgi:xanthine dehydrogenase accessory factor